MSTFDKIKMQLDQYLKKEVTKKHTEEIAELVSDRSESSSYLFTDSSMKSSKSSGSTVSESESMSSNGRSDSEEEEEKGNIDPLKAPELEKIEKILFKRQNVTDKLLSATRTSLVNAFSKTLAKNIHKTVDDVETHI